MSVQLNIHFTQHDFSQIIMITSMNTLIEILHQEIVNVIYTCNSLDLCDVTRYPLFYPKVILLYISCVFVHANVSLVMAGIHY